MGIKKRDVLKFKGGLSSVIIIPNPRVTAEVERGSIKRGSRKLAIFPLAYLIANAAAPPTTSAMARVEPANKRELEMAFTGEI